LILAVGLGFLVGRAGHESSSSDNHGPRAESAPQVEEETATRKTQEQLHAKVPLAKPTAKLGESCTQGTLGCGKSKKFNGVFFGAEE
jgi:hypothetical protein